MSHEQSITIEHQGRSYNIPTAGYNSPEAAIQAFLQGKLRPLGSYSLPDVAVSEAQKRSRSFDGPPPFKPIVNTVDPRYSDEIRDDSMGEGDYFNPRNFRGDYDISTLQQALEAAHRRGTSRQITPLDNPSYDRRFTLQQLLSPFLLKGL